MATTPPSSSPSLSSPNDESSPSKHVSPSSTPPSLPLLPSSSVSGSIATLASVVQHVSANTNRNDDVSQILNTYAVFTYHGKVKRYAKSSLYCLSARSPLRKLAVWLINYPWFQRLIFLCILVNSAILGIADFQYIDIQGNLLSANSYRNYILIQSEPVFTAIFATEAVLKIIAMGFLMAPGSYLRDGWNLLDFIIVSLALLANVPNMPNYTGLRVARVLRPLRSLTAVPSLRRVIAALLRALPALVNVLILLIFCYTVFGIFCLQLYSGTMHGRCRLTEYPVQMNSSLYTVYNSTTNTSFFNPLGVCSDTNSWECFASIANLTAYSDSNVAYSSYYSGSLNMNVHKWVNDSRLKPCIPGLTPDDVKIHRSFVSAQIEYDTGPWTTPQTCWWPIDPMNRRLCSLSYWGAHQCPPGRVCGSNYDTQGRSRFTDKLVMWGDLYITELNWGMTVFDNTLYAFLSIFQMTTLEGWSVLLYMVQAGNDPVFAALLFIFIILLMAYFGLNLTLAVLWDSFKKSTEAERLAAEQQQRLLAALKAEAMRVEIERLRALREAVEKENKEQRIQRALRRRQRKLEKEHKRLLAETEGINVKDSNGTSLSNPNNTIPSKNNAEEEYSDSTEDSAEEDTEPSKSKPLANINRQGKRIARFAKQFGDQMVDGMMDMTTELKSVHTKLASDVLTVTQKVTNLAEKTATSTTDAFRRVVEDPSDDQNQSLPPINRLRSFAVTNKDDLGKLEPAPNTSGSIGNYKNVQRVRKLTSNQSVETNDNEDGKGEGSSIYLPLPVEERNESDTRNKETKVAIPLSENQIGTKDNIIDAVSPHIVPESELSSSSSSLSTLPSTTTEPKIHKHSTPIRHHSTVLVPGTTPSDIANLVQFVPMDSLEVPKLQLSRASSLRVLTMVEQQNYYDHVNQMKTVIERDNSDNSEDDDEDEDEEEDEHYFQRGNPSVMTGIASQTGLMSLEAELRLECAKAAAIGIDVTEAKQVENRLKDASLGTFGIKHIGALDDDDDADRQTVEQQSVTAALATAIETQRIEEKQVKLRKQQLQQQEKLNRSSSNIPLGSMDTFAASTKRRFSALFIPSDGNLPPTDSSSTVVVSTTVPSSTGGGFVPDDDNDDTMKKKTSNGKDNQSNHTLILIPPEQSVITTTDRISIPVAESPTVHQSTAGPIPETLSVVPIAVSTLGKDFSSEKTSSASTTMSTLNSPYTVNMLENVRNRIALMYPTVYRPSGLFLREYLLHRPVSLSERIVQNVRDYLRKPHQRTYLGTIGYQIVSSRFWSSVITSLIIGNTIILCFDQYPNDSTLQNNLEIANLIFLCSFTFDILCKFFAHGLIGFFLDNWNTFDFLVISSSIIELLVDPPVVFRTWTAQVGLPAIWSTIPSNSNLDKVNSTSLTLITLIDPVYLEGTVLSVQTAGKVTTALRTFRLFRVFKLARSWTALNVLLRTTLRSIKDAANFAMLLAVFVYVFSLIGMQIFANRFCYDPDTGLPTAGSENQLPDCDGTKPRARFDTLYFASLTVFQIFTLENWNVVLDDAWRAVGWSSSLYFVILILIGQYIVLDLFEAVLLSNFEKISELVVTDRIVRRKALELLTSQVTFGKKGLQLFKKGLEAIPLDQLKEALANGPEGLHKIRNQLTSTTRNVAKLLAKSHKLIGPVGNERKEESSTIIKSKVSLSPQPKYTISTIHPPNDDNSVPTPVIEPKELSSTASTRSDHSSSWLQHRFYVFRAKHSAKVAPLDPNEDPNALSTSASSLSQTLTPIDTPRSNRSLTSSITTSPISYALDHQNSSTGNDSSMINRDIELAKLPGMKKHISFEIKAELVDRDELGSIYSYDSTNLFRTLTNHSEIQTNEFNELEDDDTVDNDTVPVEQTYTKEKEFMEISNALETGNKNVTVPLPETPNITMDEIMRENSAVPTIISENVSKNDLQLPVMNTTVTTPETTSVTSPKLLDDNENKLKKDSLSVHNLPNPPLTIRTPLSPGTQAQTLVSMGTSSRRLFQVPSSVLSSLNNINFSTSVSRSLFSDDDITDIPSLTSQYRSTRNNNTVLPYRRHLPNSLSSKFSTTNTPEAFLLTTTVNASVNPITNGLGSLSVSTAEAPLSSSLSKIPEQSPNIDTSLPSGTKNSMHSDNNNNNNNNPAGSIHPSHVDEALPPPSPPPPQVASVLPPNRSLSGRSLFIFTEHSYVRKYCKYLIDYPLFDRFIMLTIILSSILLALDSPLLPSDHIIVLTTYYVDILVTVLFALESTARIIVNGLVFNGKRSYLRSPWNIVDAIVVILNILSLVVRESSVPSLRSLRALRATRPLRIIRALPGLRLIINSIAASLPGIFNVLFVVILSLLIFAVIAVGNLKGALWSCQGDTFDNFPLYVQNLVIYPPIVGELSYEQKNYLVLRNITYGPVVNIDLNTTTTTGNSLLSSSHELLVWSIVRPTSKSVCILLGGKWEHVLPGTAHFDNVWCGLLTLLTMTTTEGWVDVLHALTDQRGVEMQPIPDSSVYWSVYAILVMIIGSFFIMKMFVGVVLDNYNIMRERLGGNAFLTPEQRLWIKTQKILVRIRPYRRIGYDGSTPLRVLCWKIASNRYFELLITISILMNTITMALPYLGQSWSYGNSIIIINLFFNCVFTLEAILKVIALHWIYFTDNWNRFDFFIMLGTNIGIVLEAGFGYTVGVVAMAIRAVRLTRILRLFNRENALIKIYTTFLLGLPSLMNTGGLLSLILYVYSIIGMELFATVQWGGGGRYGYGGSTGVTQGLSREANFQTFPLAFLTLFRCFTGESWHMIMSDAADNPVNCVKDFATVPWITKQNMCGFRNYNDFYNPLTQTYDSCIPINGCGSTYSYPFFVTYIFIVYYIFVNLLVAVILEGFAESEHDEAARLSDKHFQQVATIWSRFDPKATLFLDANDLPMVIQQLDEPMGFGKAHIATVYQLRKRVAKLKIPIYQGSRVHFVDFAAALARRVFIDDARKIHQKDFHIPENYETKRIRKKLPTYTLDRTGFHVGHVYAVRLIQLAWRNIHKRRKLREQKRASIIHDNGGVPRKE